MNMASDLKIEIFALKIFQKSWYDYEELENEPDIIRIYGDECAGDDSYLEACDEVFLEAIKDRSSVFSNFYYIATDLVEDVKNFTSLSEVCDYVIDTLDRDDLFGELSVFERMLATSDYAMSICYNIHLEVGCLKDVLKYSHIFWAMYFDKFTEEFYKNGGWNKLKIVSKSYHLLTDMFDILGLKTLWGTLKRLKESVLNYNSFKRVLQYYKSKGSNRERKTVSVQWVKFSIEFIYSSARLPLDYENYADAIEVNLLLEDARLCCDSSLFNKIYGKETISENSKESSLTEKAKTIENSLKIDNAFYKEISEVVEFDATNNMDNSHFNNMIRTETEMIEHISPDVELTGNTHHKQKVLNNLTMHRQTGEKQKLPKIVDEDCTLYASKNIESKNAEFYSRNLEEQSEMPVITEVFSINQKDEYECYRGTVSRGFCNPKDIGSRNECLSSANETINTKKELEGNVFSKGRIENIKAKYKETVNQMTVSTCDEISATDTGFESESVQNARQDLRNEQNDPEIMTFLRLMLVLGDKQGLKFVLATLRDNKVSSVNLQGKSNKKKKRSENKKSKCDFVTLV